MRFKSFVIPQISSASISFVASTSMAIMIARTGPRLSVPYRRIIFGLSIADMAQSLGLLVGPISLPQSVPGSWGLGNEATCKASGFLVLVGYLSVPMYTCFVCWYYLCKLKYRLPDESFSNRSERKLHAFIILIVMILALTALEMDTLHPMPSRTFCWITPTPIGCRKFTGLECDATTRSRVDIFYAIYISLQLACIFGVVGIMCMIYWHVIRQNRIHQPHQSINRREMNAGDAATLFQTPERGTSTVQERVLHLSSLYRNEIALQATLYVGVFILIYVPMMVMYWLVRASRIPPNSFAIMTMTFFPLGGFFNILVYSRPKAASLRRAQPQLSRLLCFWLVLRAGGEIPERLSRQDINVNDLHSLPSNHPFGVSNISSRGLSLGEGVLDSIPELNLARVEEGISTDLDRTTTTVKMGSDLSQADGR